MILTMVDSADMSKTVKSWRCQAWTESDNDGCSINQFFNYRNVKTHFHMRKTQSSKIYV